MPLDRAHVTIASRTMLPVYILVELAFGIAYTTDPGNRLNLAPSVEFQRELMPLWLWGLLQLTLALLMAAALAAHHRATFAYALAVGAVTWFLWGASIGASIFLTPNTSYLAPVLPWFVTLACVASMRSLLAREATL